MGTRTYGDVWGRTYGDGAKNLTNFILPHLSPLRHADVWGRKTYGDGAKNLTTYGDGAKNLTDFIMPHLSPLRHATKRIDYVLYVLLRLQGHVAQHGLQFREVLAAAGVGGPAVTLFKHEFFHCNQYLF